MSGAQGFSWRSTKDGRVLIDWGGRTVTTLAGKRAARVTGNFKRGNER